MALKLFPDYATKHATAPVETVGPDYNSRRQVIAATVPLMMPAAWLLCC